MGMTLYWTSLDQFLAMGGYGPYVWGSFGITALAIAVELWGLRLRRKALLSEIETS
jgi:heme exporter protein D